MARGVGYGDMKNEAVSNKMKRRKKRKGKRGKEKEEKEKGESKLFLIYGTLMMIIVY